MKKIFIKLKDSRSHKHTTFRLTRIGKIKRFSAAALCYAKIRRMIFYFRHDANFDAYFMEAHSVLYSKTGSKFNSTVPSVHSMQGLV